MGKRRGRRTPAEAVSGLLQDYYMFFLLGGVAVTALAIAGIRVLARKRRKREDRRQGLAAPPGTEKEGIMKGIMQRMRKGGRWLTFLFAFALLFGTGLGARAAEDGGEPYDADAKGASRWSCPSRAGTGKMWRSASIRWARLMPERLSLVHTGGQPERSGRR